MIKRRLLVIANITLILLLALIVFIKLRLIPFIIVSGIFTFIGIVYSILYSYFLYLSKKINNFNSKVESEYLKSTDPDKKLIHLSVDQMLQLSKFGAVKDPISGEIVTKK